MSGVIGSGGISVRGMAQEMFIYPCLISGSPSDSDVGAALTQDTGAANTFKLAGDGDPIHGWLETLETRSVEGVTVGAISTKGGHRFTVKNGSTVNVGDEVCGGGSGTVKTLAATLESDLSTTTIAVKAASAQKRNRVWQVETISGVDYATVVLE